MHTAWDYSLTTCRGVLEANLALQVLIEARERDIAVVSDSFINTLTCTPLLKFCFVYSFYLAA